MSASDGLRLECVSNSSQSRVGVITWPDGSTLPLNYYTPDWRLTNPFNRPGVLRLQTDYGSMMSSAVQGIYTCTIPDNNGKEYIINVGLYPSGFRGELCSMLH